MSNDNYTDFEILTGIAYSVRIVLYNEAAAKYGEANIKRLITDGLLTFRLLSLEVGLSFRGAKYLMEQRYSVEESADA